MVKAKQQRSNFNWEGMLKRWSIDKGTRHLAHSIENVYDHPLLSDGTGHPPPPPQWRGKTKEFFMTQEQPKYYDISDRVYDINCSFSMPGQYASDYKDTDSDEVEDEKEVAYQNQLNEDLLDELQEYAEFTDVASVLHSEGCLFTFVCKVLSNKLAGIRAKAAEVITTMLQNYPTSQQLLIEEKCLQLLLNTFTSDPDETSRTKALGAISALIRNNKSGITAFRQEKGYAALRKALISRSVCQREVVNLIEYLLRENNLYSQEMNLAFCDDAEVRGAALRGLLVLARRKCEYLSPCCCFYHRSKQFKLHLRTVKKRKEKKKQFKLEKNVSPYTPTVQGNSSSTSNDRQSNPSVSL